MQEPGYYDKILPGITFDTLSEMTEEEFSQSRGGAQPEELAIFRQQKTQIGMTHMTFRCLCQFPYLAYIECAQIY